MTDSKNTIIAIVLSAVVLIGWQYFFGLPQLKKQQEAAQQQQSQQIAQQQSQQMAQQQGQGSAQSGQGSAQPGQQGSTQPGQGSAQPGQQGSAPPQGAAPGQPGSAASQAPNAPAGAPGAPQTTPAAAQAMTREAALAASPRVPIRTPSISGSIALKGGRIDDIALVKFRETVDPKSPPIVLLSPSGSPEPFYAEFGWTGAAGSHARLPDANTMWTQEGSGALGVGHPVTLTWDNGQGLQFRRTIAIDDKYMFTITDEVANKSAETVSLYPYGLVSRHGTPKTVGTYILHEGLIGYLGADGLQEITYSKIKDKKTLAFDVTNGWLGITDKYWAAALVPATDAHLKARYSATDVNGQENYQTDYLLDARTVAPGATASASTRLFAGAKEVSVVNAYEKDLALDHFDLLIDWGWFYFITKPMFMVIDWFYHLVGNFGIAILIVTVLIKAAFFPLANKSYASMAKMKAVQPQMKALRERFSDDKARQQQELMELYRKEKINPLAGCLPIAVQIPVFYSLYKVLYVTIEMRHAPFFGWIKDLSAPDPTNVFTLFGLVHWDPTAVPMIGHFLHLGIWPLIMGVTMWAQMKLNPTPPDPTQAMIFNWMPVIFTFMLGSFPAGLVIYWAWNNTLSVTQQSIIMKKHGAKIELLDNIKALFGKKKSAGS